MREKNQVVLPLDLGICIPEGDFVFKVAEICESLDYTELFNTYLRVWRKVNPITIFEILVFAYMNRKFSSRDIENLCKTDIRFMWLLNGEPVPSDSTITRFQRGHLAEAIEGLFYQFVEKLYEMGEIKFKNLFVDGTKLEAYANKYTFVWKSAVEKNLAKLEKKMEVLLSVLSERYGFSEDISLEECYEHLLRQAQWLNLVFAVGKGKHKTQLQRDIEVLKEYIDKKAEYRSHLGKFGNRNSFSKTDTDATFMHMKEDHMKNGQLKPGYNVNVATVSEYIIGNYLSADRTDTKTFIPFLEKLCEKHPVKRVVVDSGYESEENYRYVEGHEQLSLFVKPSNHEQKKKQKYQNDPGRRENMAYDADKDEYTCAAGRTLKAVGTKKRKSEAGFEQEVTVYECADCSGCPLKEKCIRQKKTDKTPIADRVKRLNVSKYFVTQREAMEEKISTEEGILLRINRSIQAEGVFAMIKEDMNFRRFLMRGKRNVTVEWNLISMAYNLLKLHHKIQNGRLGRHLIVPKVA